VGQARPGIGRSPSGGLARFLGPGTAQAPGVRNVVARGSNGVVRASAKQQVRIGGQSSGSVMSQITGWHA